MKLPIDTEVEDITPILTEYLQTNLVDDKIYHFIDNKDSSTYRDGVLVPDKYESQESKESILEKVYNHWRYEGDRLFTKCKTRENNFTERIICTEYRPRYKQARAEGQPYTGVLDFVFNVSNNVNNSITSDIIASDKKVVIIINKKTKEIKTVKIEY